MSAFEQDPQDRAIDELLQALGAQVPPAGMEQRVLDKLERLDAAGAPARRGGAWGFPAGVFGLTAIVAVVLAVVLLHGRRPENRHAGGTNAQAAASVAAANPVAGSGALTAGNVSVASQRHGAIAATASSDARGAGGEHAVRVAANTADDATLPIGFPAPRMPLTEQERLLLRVARRGEPEQIALLDPTLRELDVAFESAQFDKFFAPVPIPAPPAAPASEPVPDESPTSPVTPTSGDQP